MKTFQIGFNRCGTLSLHKFFEKNGLKSIHWDNGKLAKTILVNYKNNRQLLTGYEQFDCFTDMEAVGATKSIYISEILLAELDQQYPESVFILNVRPVDRLIGSRLRHNNGIYATKIKSIHNFDDNKLMDYWRARFYEHCTYVCQYFSGKANLLHFDIENDRIDKLINFYLERGVALDSQHWGHFHKTKA